MKVFEALLDLQSSKHLNEFLLPNQDADSFGVLLRSVTREDIERAAQEECWALLSRRVYAVASVEIIQQHALT